MKRGPLEVVKVKTSTIPIYAETHHGKSAFLIAYYADGMRRRERFSTFDEARKQAKAKAQELATGAAHVGNFTPEQTATIKSAIGLLRVSGSKLLPAVQEYVEARKVLRGGRLASMQRGIMRNTWRTRRGRLNSRQSLCLN